MARRSTICVIRPENIGLVTFPLMLGMGYLDVGWIDCMHGPSSEREITGWPP